MLGTAITPNPLRARVAVAHVANGFIVIHQPDLVGNGGKIGRSVGVIQHRLFS
jgi:hypothetical protein